MTFLMRWMAPLLVFALLATGCVGGSDEAAAPTAEPVASATVAPPTAVPPTAVPESTNVVPELTNDDRTAAALAAFQANPQPAGVIAWDVLETVHRGVNTVDIITCGWTGESAFDDRTVTTYRVPHDDNGALLVVFESSAGTLGECVNTELIESALQATRDYDLYWGSVLEDPDRFKAALAATLMTPEHVVDLADVTARWAEDDLFWMGHEFDAALPASSIMPMLWRRYESAGTTALELMSCREVDPRFGLYRGTTLIDDFRTDEARGSHAIDRYFLVRGDGSWLVAGVEDTVWADCSSFSSGWLEGVNNWRAEPTRWELTPR